MIAQIEDAILAKIAAANDGRLGYKFAAIETYGGDFDEKMEEVVRRMPGVWVAYAGGGKPVPYGTGKVKWKVPATFAVMVGARSVRSEPFSRRGLEASDGTVLEAGSYHMLTDVRRILLNQDFGGMEIARFEPGAVRTLYNTTLNRQAFSIFAQEWHTAFIVEPESTADTDADWMRLGINYFLKPGDDVADAADLVTLNP